MSLRHSSHQLSILTLIATQAFLSAPVFAAGFQLNELSPGLLGNALAGAGATKNDVSSMFINPATLGNMIDNQAYLGINFIFPKIEMSDATAIHTINTAPPVPPTTISAIVLGDNDQANVAKGAPIPNGYVSYRINEQLVAGLAVVAPFGLTTDYNNDSVVRFAALNSAIRTIDIVPTLAFSFNKQFSVGVGFQAQYIKAHFSNFNGPYTGTPLDNVIAANFRTHLSGHDWGFGYTLGGLYNMDDCTRFGIGFRSQIVQHLEGSGEQFVHPGDLQPTPVLPIPFNAASSTKAKVTTPAILNVSAAQDIYEWTIKASLQYNFWSSLDKLSINMPEAYSTNFTINTKWRNTWFAALGADYRANDQWTLRGGVAYDQTPTKDAYRDARIPDSDRYWLNVGLTYQINRAFSLDGAYSHVFTSPTKVNVTQAGGVSATSVLPLEINQVYAKYKSSVDIVSVALRYSF